MDMSNEEYLQYVEKMAGKSPLGKDCACAFLIGGAICVLGQLLRNAFLGTGMAEQAAGTATSCTLVALSALLTGLGIYPKLARYGGAGTLVPITGFANAVTSPAVDFRSEGFITGVGTKMFTIVGPVIAYGTAASVVYGFICWIAEKF